MKLFIAIAVTLLGQNAMGDQSLTQLSSANNEFAILLYKTIKVDDQNLVCSPLSVSVVLSMLLEGSPTTSTTFKEIQDALQYSDLTLTDIENGYKQLLDSLQSSQDYTLSLADSVWIEDTFPIPTEYVQKTADIFKADAKSFNQNNGKTLINQWVADHTMDKITQLLDNLDASVVMVLVNAIYFQASWTNAFKSTQSGQFFTNDNQNTGVTYMQQIFKYPYTDSATLKAKVLMLDYVGNSVSLVVILPDEGNTLVQLEKDLTSKAIDDAIKSTTSKEVNVTLPQFSITSALPLNAPLQKLGIKQAFGQADLSLIGNDLQVSEVMQKAIIEVSMNGTIAAAATEASIRLSAVLDIETFRADHPFLYVLYHKPTSSVIFIGRYTDSTT